MNEIDPNENVIVSGGDDVVADMNKNTSDFDDMAADKSVGVCNMIVDNNIRVSSKS